MSIRLHKKFGVNPTISVCVICGRDKNEIALLGASCKEQAPVRMITGIEPCDECRKEYLEVNDGVLLAEAGRDKKPTGRVIVIKREAFQRVFNVPVPVHRIAWVEDEAFVKLIGKG